jgi:hypothetical protein
MMTRTSLKLAIFLAAVPSLLNAQNANPKQKADGPFDVVIYGATSAGIAAAVQVKRLGGTVVLIEPTKRIGGLTTGGLGQTDIGNKAAIGGISREFYQRVRTLYNKPSNWKWQKKEEYRSLGQSRTGSNEDTLWTFEPSAALGIMHDLVKQYDILLITEERLDRAVSKSKIASGVQKQENHIVSIRLESGREIFGRVFIDATYEGDLLAGAGVSYIVGRENNADYKETLSGVQVQRSTHHQFVKGVDPYVVKGDKSSGLLPNIDPRGPGKEGSGDRRVQAFCFRMCLTDRADNRIPFKKPAGYEPLQYELLFRNFEAGAKVLPWSKGSMPNRKTDVNNNRGFSTDFIGQSYDYPEASYSERAKIIERHRVYQQGLMWTLANHPRVPEAMRREISRWGTCKDEFARADGWQQQLYIREARRMVGAYVMTQHNCQGKVTAEHPVGLAAYTMDSHNVQRYVDPNGQVRNEGDVQVGGFSPYPIDYLSLTPRANECDNLLVPVCISATHMAFGSIRMEPVFMVLGQSAATAAMQSIRTKKPVQDIDYKILKEQLLRDKQVLLWTGPKRKPAQGIDLTTLKGIVVDDSKADYDGFDSTSSSTSPFVGIGYRHDGNTAKGQQSIKFKAQIQQAGRYEVRVAWSAFSNRATNVPVTVHHAKGVSTVKINQRVKAKFGPFGTIGVYDFEKGTAVIQLSNANTDGYVVADAVQFLPVAR